MRRWFQFAPLLLGLLLALGSCKKKPPQVPQPQANAPDITSVPQPKQPEPLPPSAPPTPTATQPPKPKPQARKKAAKKTPPTPEVSRPKSTVHEPGSESPGQLSAAQPQEAASVQRRNAAQLVATADANLRSLNRSLSLDEQSMVQQIRAYMQQSNLAATDGDTDRAYNLALKARLLSDELVKR